MKQLRLFKRSISRFGFKVEKNQKIVEEDLQNQRENLEKEMNQLEIQKVDYLVDKLF